MIIINFTFFEVFLELNLFKPSDSFRIIVESLLSAIVFVLLLAMSLWIELTSMTGVSFLVDLLTNLNSSTFLSGGSGLEKSCSKKSVSSNSVVLFRSSSAVDFSSASNCLISLSREDSIKSVLASLALVSLFFFAVSSFSNKELILI